MFGSHFFNLVQMVFVVSPLQSSSLSLVSVKETWMQQSILASETDNL